MNRFILQIFCIIFLLSSKIFGYWNPSKFEQLKTVLGGEKNTPFYIVGITRSGTESLNEIDKWGIRNILEIILRGKGISSFEEACDKIKEIADPSNDLLKFYQQSDFNMRKALFNEKTKQNKIKIDLTNEVNAFIDKLNKSLNSENQSMLLINKPGFVIFNEYFFGQMPVPYEFAKKISEEFSQIDSSKIFMCNFLTYSPADNDADSEIKKFIQYQERKIDELEARCNTDVIDICGKPEWKIENKTFFYRNKNLLATYKKSTYRNESDDFLKGNKNENKLSLAYYSFGNWDIKSENIQSLTETLVENISPQVCLDYSFCRSKWNANFQIIQSNSCSPPNEPFYYSKKLFDRDVQIHEGIPYCANKSRYIIHCDPFSLNPDSLNMIYHQNKEQKLEEVPPLFKPITFNFNEQSYTISITEIKWFAR